MQLSQINIFPVKSLDGYSPNSAIVEKRGLQHDRRWLITEPDGTFMTQRTHTKMALLKAVIEGQFLRIFEKNDPENCLKIAIDTEGSDKEVQVWDDTIQASQTNDEADEFLSDFLGKSCTLMKMNDRYDRRVDEDYNLGNDIVSFADAYPFLIIGESSMEDLNQRLGVPLSIRRFRTNFVFSGGLPFIEDTFKNFRIGEVDFVGVKKCARCVLTTRDPDNGVKGREPMATLQTYRSHGTKILFGQNVVFDAQKWNWAWQPEVKVGDALTQG
ncbi:MAG: MOSC N-terminal beta barrel domain-containing protein [Saprospiraceae bacterium]|nr:MOSC N-terminal beta barrel domain-containing protein [Saprospiraceae bacterium]